MSDVREDIERAMRERETVSEPYRTAAKGAAVFGGGIIAGRYIGKKLLRAMQKRNLGKTAMDHVRLGDVAGADNFARFGSSLRKAKRK